MHSVRLVARGSVAETTADAQQPYLDKPHVHSVSTGVAAPLGDPAPRRDKNDGNMVFPDGVVASTAASGSLAEEPHSIELNDVGCSAGTAAAAVEDCACC